MLQGKPFKLRWLSWKQRRFYLLRLLDALRLRGSRGGLGKRLGRGKLFELDARTWTVLAGN